MNNELLQWAMQTFGDVTFESATTKEGNKRLTVNRGGKNYSIAVHDNMRPEDFLMEMKINDLRLLQSQLDALPGTKKALQNSIKALKKNIKDCLGKSIEEIESSGKTYNYTAVIPM